MGDGGHKHGSLTVGDRERVRWPRKIPWSRTYLRSDATVNWFSQDSSGITHFGKQGISDMIRCMVCVRITRLRVWRRDGKSWG